MRTSAEGRPRGHLPRQLLQRQTREHPSSARLPKLRNHPPRHRRADPARSRTNLQSGLPRVAGALPVQPGEDREDQRARRHQYARDGEAGARAHPAHLDQRGLWRSRGPSAERRILGQRQSERRALLLRRRQARRRMPDDELPSPEQGRREDRAHLQHLRSADGDQRRPRGFELSASPRSRASRWSFTATAARRVRLRTSTTSSKRSCA